jgi:hypothetical protein
MTVRAGDAQMWYWTGEVVGVGAANPHLVGSRSSMVMAQTMMYYRPEP